MKEKSVDDPLKPQLNYSEALKYIKEREGALLLKERDLADRQEKLLDDEKEFDNTQTQRKSELLELDREKTNLKADVKKLQFKVEGEKERLEAQEKDSETRISELKSQISNLENSYKLNLGRNGDLAKGIRSLEVELASKRRDFDELIRYYTEQEKSVSEALEAYNGQLQASVSRLEELEQDKAKSTDELNTLGYQIGTMRELAEKEKDKLETELIELEEQVAVTKINLDSTRTELDEAQQNLSRVKDAQEKTLKDTEAIISKTLTLQKEKKTSERLERKAFRL